MKEFIAFCATYPVTSKASPNFLLINSCATSSSYTESTTTRLGRLDLIIFIPSNSNSTEQEVLPNDVTFDPEPYNAKYIPKRILLFP